MEHATFEERNKELAQLGYTAANLEMGEYHLLDYQKKVVAGKWQQLKSYINTNNKSHLVMLVIMLLVENANLVTVLTRNVNQTIAEQNQKEAANGSPSF